MKFIAVLMMLVFVGCASERPSRTSSQILTPDQLRMHMGINLDERDDYDGHSTIDSFRIGLSWNL